MITGVILAGGRSTRMGQDKASLPFGDETLLSRSIRLVGSVADQVMVVARANQGGVEPFLGLPVPVVFDPIDDLGPLAGIAAGLGASTTELNLIVACDMPLVKPAVLRRLLALQGEADICLAVIDGQPSPLCAVYRRAVGAVAQDMLAAGERRVMTLLDRVQTKRVDAAVFRDIDPNLDTFLGCNTPEAYERALRAAP
jgi:molybdopterin-guanine dinucleotide biosynthesis protein A